MQKSDVKREKKLILEMEGCNNLSKKDREELLRLKCRTNFLTYAKFITSGDFKPYPVHSLVCDFVQEIADGNPDYSHTIISLPPRSGKSMLISKILPSWQVGRSPKAQHIMSSYALGLSTENSRAVLNYVLSEKFKWIFPECEVKSDKCNLTTIRTQQTGLVKVASAGGNVTGFGFGCISDLEVPGLGILDDLLADGNSEIVMDNTFSWVQTQFLTRALPNNAIMVMGTRFHKDDVTGRLLAAAPDLWKVLNIPALCIDEENDPLGRLLGQSHWPDFFPVSALNIIKQNIGEKDFQALYQGSPITVGGAIFKHHWITTYEETNRKYSYIYITVDSAHRDKTKNDYSAICVWGYSRTDQKIYLIDVLVERLEFPDLISRVKTMISLHKVRVIYIEGAASGIPLVQSLRQSLSITVKEIVPNKDKVLRANSVAPILEGGHVEINHNINSIDERITELTAFPYIRNDDFVDAFVYGLIILRDEIGINKKVPIHINSAPKNNNEDNEHIHKIETNTDKVLTEKVSRIFTTNPSTRIQFR